jgi:hypothetical protein
VVDGLPSPNEKDIDILRAAGRRRRIGASLKVFSALVLLALFLLIITLIALKPSDDPSHLNRLLTDLTRYSGGWAVDLSHSIVSYRDWLTSHGTATEVELFERLSIAIGEGSVSTAGGEDGQLGWFSSLSLSLQSGALRLGFLMIASFRLWLVVMLCCAAYGFSTSEPYRGDDLLGQTGNGRVFYSGVRAGLDKLSASGAPDVLVRGLACPQFSSAAEARASAAWRVLERWGAVNATNEMLCAIITRNADVATFVASSGEEGALLAAYAESSIGQSTPHLLDAALALHAHYGAESAAGGSPYPAATVKGSGPLTAESYAKVLQAAFDRVLTQHMRRTVGTLPATEVATLVLALEAAKVLAYQADGGRWTRRSNFVHLNARAVLHSLLEFPEDYSFESRATIRRALIYAARKSAFAPIRMPLDLTAEEWSLRQWAEVLISLPHELEEAAEEIELVGIIREGHEAWRSEFFERSIAASPALTSVSYVTPYNLLFIPFRSLIAVLRKTLPAQAVDRMHALATTISERQLRNKPEEEEGGLPTSDRIASPLSEEEATRLAALHDVDRGDLLAWSALRLILTSYSWLGRRVGDYTVPESSIIFAVFNVDRTNPEANALGLVGKSGMVAVRGGKLLEQLGPSWAARFISVHSATMAENREDFEKLLKGIREQDPEVDPSIEPIVGT